MTTTSEKPMQTQEIIDAAHTDVVPPHSVSVHQETSNGPGSGRTIGILFAIVLLIAIAYGIHLRSSNERKLEHATNEATILTVNVVHPSLGSAAQDLTLPGNVQAFTETPIYSRTRVAERLMAFLSS